ncbi:dihydrofolate reductase family protein [uncultured Roseibium sp.]|uniref:dihydrofolate reductase family protein n=1 Tax=uncultured Roseibium sp. TaxID=1936171 RepID=UPI00262FC81E|nr:dihydrofolate reductase family protein [uncultured Roseibium sp.]
MRKIAALTFVTLNGVMQAPSMPEEDRSGDFGQGGWATPYWEGVMEQVQAEAMAEPYDMLFGRKTYELFAGHWPDVDDNPVADRMNRARKYVVTSSTEPLAWTNSQPIAGDLAKEIARLKSQAGPLLQIHGSWQLIQFLLAHKLIDEFRLWTFPVVVGSGKRLFDKSAPECKLKLVRSAACVNGAVMSIYERG